MIPWSRARFLLRRLDWGFLIAMFLLAGVGLLFIYSASYRSDDDPFSGMVRRQALWVLVGSGCFLVAALFDYHRLAESSWWIYAACLALLVLVLLIGRKVYGAYRWLNVFGIQVQPSEFAKLGMIVCLAVYLSRPQRQLSSPLAVLKTLAMVAPPFLLIARQPDLGTALTLVALMAAMMFAAGVPVRYLAGLALIGLLCLPLGWFALGDYQKERVMVFLDPGRDPLGSGWNKIQSEIAVGSGGMTGKGYLKGTQNILGYLPKTVAHTDFIFSVVAEETGFAGSVFLIALFGGVMTAGLRAAWRARDAFGRLLAVGVIALFACHVFVNMAMTIGLMPVTGLPLPLISYGGSFTVCTMTGLGLVQSVYVRRQRR